ncbi:Methyl-accepting chemotaxis protein [Pseudomonas savastanoi pv. nerii]|uniref:Methyl-accepting chemotaxis protein n=5 Tax=Pseudomonas syringae group genomosp. 2 TaxID=251698 RepID=A0AB74BID8_PSESS|nr:hypothetical protein AC519_1592 [Pseudomonas savastanoi]KPY44072.1 Methyl-accepting chemotaxis protein [Pseudomonas savastanoi pv. retacarpa]RMP46921.1 hypothetical protein ALQ22_200156 [Pseudomonas savastanoi pv. retacarpa]RMR71587.1 Methyl-accepting chemotaxis protein [Pseudomonas savastanoi pv. fraxini]RMT76240.1 Methyl-accepting chemotaxis protein [Pseudomonas savastanoi pv. nerii]
MKNINGFMDNSTMKNTFTPNDTAFTGQVPDRDIMTRSLHLMRNSLIKADLLFAKTQYLPNLYEKLTRLNTLAVTEQHHLGEHAERLIIDIESKTALLRQYAQPSATPIDAEELKDIDVQCQRLVNNATATAQQLASALSGMTQGIDRQQTAEFGQSLQGDMANAGTRLDVLHTTLAKLNEERQVLSTAIDALESKGATSIAKDTLITADKVLSLGMQPPELAVIMLALEQMKATLEKGEAGINLIAMIKRRDGFRERINALSQQLAGMDKEKMALAQRIELIECFNAFDEQRAAYVEQYQKIKNTLDSFLVVNTKGASDDRQRSMRLIESGQQLIGYLNRIR